MAKTLDQLTIDVDKHTTKLSDLEAKITNLEGIIKNLQVVVNSLTVTDEISGWKRWKEQNPQTTQTKAASG